VIGGDLGRMATELAPHIAGELDRQVRLQLG
jgi:hypothetical protein